MSDVSRFLAKNYPGHTKVTQREKPPTGSPVRRPFARVYQDEFAFFRRTFDPASALLLELIRQSGLEVIKKRDGWVLLSDRNLKTIGLSDRFIHYRAVRRLVAGGCIEIKADAGHKSQYRLSPDWAKPKAEVIALATPEEGETALIEMPINLTTKNAASIRRLLPGDGSTGGTACISDTAGPVLMCDR